MAEEAYIANTHLYKNALRLSVFTMVYNIVEAVVSTLLGFSDSSLSLFGFGVDSFIEVISGFGILQMVLKMQNNQNGSRTQYEHIALRVTGVSLYILAVGLLVTAIYNFVTGQNPTTSIHGLVISLVSIAVMLVLIYRKIKVGKALNSKAILADAECAKVCIYMSIVLLLASTIYQWTKLPHIDSIGALVIAYFAFKEGQECFKTQTH